MMIATRHLLLNLNKSTFLPFFILFCLFNCINYSIKANTTPIGERKIEINQNWKFTIDPNNEGEDAHWYNSNYNYFGWKNVSIPHNWDLDNEYANYKGKTWYRTTFETPTATNKKIVLSFGEVAMSYKVFLNGKLIADILCGNYREDFDVTTLLKPNASNSLAVMVDNSLKWGAYWSWGGIRRPITLLIKEQVNIRRQQIVSIPDLTKGTAIVKTNVLIENTTNQPQSMAINQQLYFNQSLVKGSKPLPVSIAANSTAEYSFQISLTKEQVKLWHIDHPNMYTSSVLLNQDKKTTYQLNDKFGIRKIEIDGYHFKLNGESVRLTGYNWVADDRTTGNTLPEFRYKEDIDYMKQTGQNMARLSHRPLPEDVMDYLDEKGILVLAEFNNWADFMNAQSEEPKTFATKLVQQKFNHPCVIGWSVGNENGSLKENPKVNEYVESIIKFIKTKLDSSHLVTYVSNTADFQDNDAAQYCDVIMINKYGSYSKGIDALKLRYPNKAVFMSEYGGYLTAGNLIYDTPDKTVFKKFMVDSLGLKENLFGYSLWTYNDYRSNYQSPNPETTTPLHQNRQWGIVDVYRNKKRAFRQMQKYYAPVKSLNITLGTPLNGVYKSELSLQPRSKMDIPAFTLSGYKLVWEIRNEDNKNEQSGFINLPDVVPSGNLLNYPLEWKKTEKTIFFKLSLLSSTGYVVMDTTFFVSPPPSPKINAFIPADKEARMVFEKSPFATEYILKYSDNGVVKSLNPTIDHYADLTTLPIGKEYKIWVVATNSFGESSPSPTYSFSTKAGYSSLPPIIWLSESANQGFFTGYSFHYSDFIYEVRFGTDLNEKQQWKIISSGTFGLMQVPNLVNGTNYYYQIRRKSAFNSNASEWSEVKSVIPNEGHQSGSPIIHGFVQIGNEIVISCTPSHNAKGFKVVCKTNKGNKEILINESVPTLINLTDIIDKVDDVIIYSL